MVLVLQPAYGAESLHLAPSGTVVSGSFELAGKVIPLPEGEFILAAARIDEARSVSVFLAQLDGQRLKSAVWASTVLEPAAARSNGVQAREWCVGENVLFRLDHAQGCLVVARRDGSFGAAATGLMQDAAAWLAYHDVALPVPVLIIARIERRELMRAAYAFNPWSYGCNRPSSQFVDSIADWGKQVQRHFDDLVMGRRTELAGYGSRIHQCASALASTP
jgi:hypothetical protein